MIRTARASLAEHFEHVCYSLLRTTVVWFVPAVVQLDERDPILGAGSVPRPNVP